MSSDTAGGRRILGVLRSADGKGVVRVEDRFDTDVEDLWSAITDPARLRRWIGDVDGDLRPGGEFRAHFLASDWQGSGRIELCDPPRRLRVLTRDDPEEPYEQGNTIEATLTADGDGTLLVWEERGMPLTMLAAYGAGVQVHVEDLAAYLAGGGRCDAQARWQELISGYQALMADVA